MQALMASLCNSETAHNGPSDDGRHIALKNFYQATPCFPFPAQRPGASSPQWLHQSQHRSDRARSRRLPWPPACARCIRPVSHPACRRVRPNARLAPQQQQYLTRCWTCKGYRRHIPVRWLACRRVRFNTRLVPQQQQYLTRCWTCKTNWLCIPMGSLAGRRVRFNTRLAPQQQQYLMRCWTCKGYRRRIPVRCLACHRPRPDDRRTLKLRGCTPAVAIESA
ncbi:hypothetical protein PHO31112_03286 [Pandoraea horticolens]|uniref:Uncharacterized protein n=1 Tax=Pandoraea horticolens TaxID=2508298 RepID=A0A5E4WJN5_9BURK|nr:hypothetical protein PHO31112_03286 [Pandoraea horticolens]